MSSLDITLLLHKYLLNHPIKNKTSNFNMKFKVHCEHVMFMCWSQVFVQSDAGHVTAYSYIIMSNSYDHLFAAKIPSLKDKDTAMVERIVIHGSVDVEGISALQWIKSSADSGTLVIGKRDGTCILLTFNASLELLSHKELELKKDYRIVEQISSVGVMY